jgi:hypothetical protein
MNVCCLPPSAPPCHVDTLKIRKEIKHLLIDLDLDRPGSYDKLLPYLNERSQTPVNKTRVYLAMTGFKSGATYGWLLLIMKALLMEWNETRLKEAV